jgi:hypothetical protein
LPLNSNRHSPTYCRDLWRVSEICPRLSKFGRIWVELSISGRQQEADTAEDDDPFADSPATVAAQSRQFDTIKELLTATRLGTS